MAVFAEKLKLLRAERGLTQEKASKRMGITRAALNSYENGLRIPGYDIAIKICRFYSVPFDYFADPEEAKPYDDATIEDVVERAKELGITPTELSAASGFSYNTLRQAMSDSNDKACLSQKSIQMLMETLEDFDFSVFRHYKKPINNVEDIRNEKRKQKQQDLRRDYP